jgi:hypothetical protein
VHDVRDPFSFKNNEQFIFHDSPGFEAGGKEEFDIVKAFIEEKVKSKNAMDQIHAIWCVSSSSLMLLELQPLFRFCFEPDVSRPLLELEKRFFEDKLAGNGGPI